MEAVSAPTSPAQALARQGGPKTPESVRAMSTTTGAPPDARLEQACADMEALFVSYLFKSMRASIPESGLLDGGHAEDIYTAMLDEEVAHQLSRQGGLGVQQMLRRQLSSSAPTSAPGGPVETPGEGACP